MRLLLAAILLLALPPLADAQGQTAFTLTGEFADGNYVWKDATGATNPTLVVPGSTPIIITIEQGASSDGIPHNLQVAGGETSEFVTNTGDKLDYTFTSPASGNVPYVCTVHPTTMKGTIQVFGTETTPTGNGDNDSPGFELALTLGALALLALARRTYQ